LNREIALLSVEISVKCIENASRICVMCVNIYVCTLDVRVPDSEYMVILLRSGSLLVALKVSYCLLFGSSDIACIIFHTN
jgi:hypothetical protein